MQRQENTITFEKNDKFTLTNHCEKCDNHITFKISLDQIFKLIESRKKATMGPIESIKALLKNKQPLLKQY